MANKPNIHQGEIGDSGVSIVSGIISGEEYNPDLLGLYGLKTWDQMRRTDATVHMVIQAINTPIISADWYIDTEGESAKEIEAKEMIQENLIEIIKFKRKLELILTMFPFGFSLFEMVFAPMTIKGKLRIGLQDLAFRKQTTITAWETRDKEPGVTQQTVRGVFDIPDANLARFTYQQEGDNYLGMSGLRSAYFHWYAKTKLYKIGLIGHERQGVGVPYAAYREGADKKEKADIEKYLSNLRANERGFMMYPQGTEVGFMDMKATSTSNLDTDISHHDRQISKNSLLQFIEIGSSGSSGTRSTSEDHSRLFELAEESLADLIAEIVTEKVIKTLVDLNFDGIEHYPKLRHGKIGDENIPVLSDAVSKFVTAGALSPRAEDENVIRRIIGWPELTEEEIKEQDEISKKARERLLQAPDKKVPSSEPAADDDEPDDKLTAEARRLHASITKRLYGRTGQAA
ncbi:DUF935 family protein [Streptomyces iakyrus]|uniref:phage portal protein family protein n=1 Tax=Streptomyces iakyrus TaxID=68219 RepID=UPI0036E92A50